MMTLYLKFILILFYALFWALHYIIKLISAFVKPEVAGNQVNNAASLAFGNMLALTSPLLIVTFGKISRHRQVIRLNSPENHELRAITIFRNTRRIPVNNLDSVSKTEVISEHQRESTTDLDRYLLNRQM